MKYLTVDSENKILGWNEDASFEGCVETDSDIPEYNLATQSLYWESSKITVKDDTDKIARNKERADNLYKENRRREYPDMGTQLNKIYDDGITKWKSEMVDPVKAKWPKDNSGPVE